MSKVVAVGKWMSKWFTLIVILWAAVNMTAPGISTWVIPNTSYLLGIILFGMGLTLTGEDFKRIAKHPVPVVLGTCAHYIIMPGLAYLLVLIFNLKGATAAGVILVGSCPSGTSSSVMAYLAGGFLFSKLIRLREPQRKAITFEVGMQDSSLGATLAIKYFAPAAAIPSTIFSIWHNISGSALSSWWRNHSQEKNSDDNRSTEAVVTTD